MAKRRIVITGLGVISPVENDVESFWQALLAGKSGIGPITTFDSSAFDSQIAGEVKSFDPLKYMDSKEAKRMEKFAQFAVAASRQAVSDAKLDLSRENTERIGVLIGCGIGSLRIVEQEYKTYLEKGPSRITPFMVPLMIVNEAAGQVSILLGLKGPNSCVTTACASGSNAIGDAFRMIQYGDADIMLAGGTESSITHLGVGGFCSLKALSRKNDTPEKASRPFDKLRDGFVIGEGAGVVILEELEHALKRNAKIYAEMAGYGMSADAYHMTAPDPSGSGAQRAMQSALSDAGLKPEEIHYINAHGTSTALNDKIESLAIKNTFGAYAHKVAISSTKSMTGHLLGAAGGVEFVVCCLSIRDSVAHPTINQEVPDPECDLDYVPNISRKMKINTALSNSLGFGGHNATLIAKKFNS
ncbi:MAG: beta-ketoacyl-[acyl-carrier-protein] synthase II [Omnitrophica WOR_2 bacterium RIFOXYC2_FULL_45_15]|nr:MAG: beta-ketoacyl-[acyl-carrier-protein] synthase II [Omnitrophica WOR_2 bacterium RIFOXYC2_FULL_45_15]HBU08818.1 beta-ketoacyl-[acyl-carrier-protein] synthase II [Candidatus Omnitrophota bacterium]